MVVEKTWMTSRGGFTGSGMGWDGMLWGKIGDGSHSWYGIIRLYIHGGIYSQRPIQTSPPSSSLPLPHAPPYSPSNMCCAIFSANAYTMLCGCPGGKNGNALASTTLNPFVPITLALESTTAIESLSLPILFVALACQTVCALR